MNKSVCLPLTLSFLSLCAIINHFSSFSFSSLPCQLSRMDNDGLCCFRRCCCRPFSSPNFHHVDVCRQLAMRVFGVISPHSTDIDISVFFFRPTLHLICQPLNVQFMVCESSRQLSHHHHPDSVDTPLDTGGLSEL